MRETKKAMFPEKQQELNFYKWPLEWMISQFYAQLDV